MRDMQLDTELIRSLREERAWSQEHLAAVSGLSVRTIQRLETHGKASHESRLALAVAFDVTPARLLSGSDPAGSAEIQTATEAGSIWPAWLDISQRDVRIGVAVTAALASVFFIYQFGQAVGETLYYLTH